MFAFDCGDGAGLNIFSPVNIVACPAADDNGARNVSGLVKDKDAGVTASPANIQVSNVAPTITNVSGPSDPLALGTTVSIVVDYEDPGLGDTHDCIFSWDDDPSNPNTTTVPGGGSADDTHNLLT